MDADSPHILLVAPVVEVRRIAMTEKLQVLWKIDLLNVTRSDVPTVTYVDYSAWNHNKALIFDKLSGT